MKKPSFRAALGWMGAGLTVSHTIYDENEGYSVMCWYRKHDGRYQMQVQESLGGIFDEWGEVMFNTDDVQAADWAIVPTVTKKVQVEALGKKPITQIHEFCGPNDNNEQSINAWLKVHPGIRVLNLIISHDPFCSTGSYTLVFETDHEILED